MAVVLRALPSLDKSVKLFCPVLYSSNNVYIEQTKRTIKFKKRKKPKKARKGFENIRQLKLVGQYTAVPSEVAAIDTKLYTSVNRELERKKMFVPRHMKMKTDGDWTNVWPGQKTFNWSTFPVPVEMKYPVKGMAVTKRRSIANLELMKIPNFLHLTPPHVSKHCEALKKFCTPWPKNLDSDYKMEHYFPVTIITRDYLLSGPSLRDDRSKFVTLKVRGKSLSLPPYPYYKFKKLAGDMYDEENDVLTLQGDRCYRRHQNYEYSIYLLSVLRDECMRVEEWESERTAEEHPEFQYKESKYYERWSQYKYQGEIQVEEKVGQCLQEMFSKKQRTKTDLDDMTRLARDIFGIKKKRKEKGKEDML